MSKKRLFSAFIFGAFVQGAFFISPSAASTEGCSLVYKIERPTYYDCSNLVIISPGNDTRLNLTLLLGDLRANENPPPVQLSLPAKPSAAPFSWMEYISSGDDETAPENNSTLFQYGEGTRCVSDTKGREDFEKAVDSNNSISIDEKNALKNARANLNPNCDDGDASLPNLAGLGQSLKSQSAKDYAAYLNAAAAFYDGKYDLADNGFATLSKNKDKWLSEASTYMRARVAINKSQLKAFDEWGNLDKPSIDKKPLIDAENYLNAYIKTYPNGRYTLSAKGLLRRVYWLNDNKEKLLNTYIAQYRNTKSNERNLNDVELANEIDLKIFGDIGDIKVTDPIMLSIIDLYRMRDAKVKNNTNLIKLSELEAQKQYFTNNKDLYDFLLANYAYYVQDNPRLVLSLIPDETNIKNFSSLQFSRQILRGLALEKVNDVNSRGFWVSMFKPANGRAQREELEIALAMYDERHNSLDKLFTSDSLIKDEYIRETMISNIADAKTLRQLNANANLAKRERDLALYTLLQKDITMGQYKDFMIDMTLLPKNATYTPDTYWQDGPVALLGVFNWQGTNSNYICPSLKAIAYELDANPKSVKYNICLGEFVRLNSVYNYYDYIAKDELGGSNTQFKGTEFSRLEAYKAIINNKSASDNDAAYSLYRAIRCYAPSGNNECGGVNVPKSQRQIWFNRLKTQYKNSPWAKELKYYW